MPSNPIRGPGGRAIRPCEPMGPRMFFVLDDGSKERGPAGLYDVDLCMKEGCHGTMKSHSSSCLLSPSRCGCMTVLPLRATLLCQVGTRGERPTTAPPFPPTIDLSCAGIEAQKFSNHHAPLKHMSPSPLRAGIHVSAYTWPAFVPVDANVLR